MVESYKQNVEHKQADTNEYKCYDLLHKLFQNKQG